MHLHEGLKFLDDEPTCFFFPKGAKGRCRSGTGVQSPFDVDIVIQQHTVISYSVFISLFLIIYTFKSLTSLVATFWVSLIYFISLSLHCKLLYDVLCLTLLIVLKKLGQNNRRAFAHAPVLKY